MPSREPPPGTIALDVDVQSWPLAEPFVISRGVKTEARVVVAGLTRNGLTGWGEAVPYARYGETPESVVAAIRSAANQLETRGAIQAALPPGAARNALDCARWHLEALETGVPVAGQVGVLDPVPVETAFTLSLGDAAAMAAKARSVPHLKLLKLKLGGAGDPERMAAVRAARPDARLVADANEAWTTDMLGPFLAAAAASGIELIEQPLPAALDDALSGLASPVPLCADESAHTSADLARLGSLYQAVNIKLDKAGGLTEGLAMAKAARTMGFKIMVGCMVATSLAMAPAFLIAQTADWVDLDGPLLLARDRPHGITITDGWISPPSRDLWG